MLITEERRDKPSDYHTVGVCSVNLTARYYDIYYYVTKKEYPLESSTKAQRALRLLASQYFQDKENLYKGN